MFSYVQKTTNATSYLLTYENEAKEHEHNVSIHVIIPEWNVVVVLFITFAWKLHWVRSVLMMHVSVGNFYSTSSITGLQGKILCLRQVFRISLVNNTTS